MQWLYKTDITVTCGWFMVGGFAAFAHSGPTFPVSCQSAIS